MKARSLLQKIYNHLPKWLKKTLIFIKNTVALYMSNDIPIFAASSAFFLIISSIPIFMLVFSTISLIPQVRIEDIIENINLLFPNLPYITKIVNYTLSVARDLSKSNVIYINAITALITGSTCLFAFIVGIRKIHDIEYTSNYVILKVLTVLNMFILYIAVIVTFILLILSGMIIELVKLYFPFAIDIIDQILSYKYLVSSIALIILTMSLYTIYFTHFPLSTSTYGSLTGIMVVLLWIFICINIVFIGACVNEVIYPQKRIEAEHKKKLQHKIEVGHLESADEEIMKKRNLVKIFKFHRPKLNSEDSYNHDN